MISKLIKLANYLDKKGLRKEADYVDWILKRATKTTHSYSQMIDDLENEDLHGLTMHTGENYIEQFEGSLATLLGKLVPDISEEALGRIMRNSSEHQDNLRSMVNRSYSVTGAAREFLEDLVQFAKRWDGSSGKPDLDYGSLEAEEDALERLRNPDYDEEEESYKSQDGQKVYILYTVDDKYEYVVLGVYSSQSSAEGARTDYIDSGVSIANDKFEIQEYTLDEYRWR